MWNKSDFENFMLGMWWKIEEYFDTSNLIIISLMKFFLFGLHYCVMVLVFTSCFYNFFYFPDAKYQDIFSYYGRLIHQMSLGSFLLSLLIFIIGYVFFFGLISLIFSINKKLTNIEISLHKNS
jgi:hypothetical protein